MATLIQFKRSSTQNDVPGTGDLSLGEIAINTYHGRMYTEKNDGSAAISEIGSNPASLTINDAITFPTADGSSNQILKTNGSGTLAWTDQPNSGVETYTYTIGSTLTVVTGNDDDSNSLSYTAASDQLYTVDIDLF
jgi:hypothetical protein